MVNQVPAVIDHEQHHGINVPLPADPRRYMSSIWTTIDREEEAGRLLIVKCLQRADFGSDDLIGNNFTVEHMLAHQVELVKPETGEVTQAYRTVLISPDGKRAAFVSLGIYQSLGQLCYVWGDPPWKGGKKVRVLQEKTSAKRTILLLQPAE